MLNLLGNQGFRLPGRPAGALLAGLLAGLLALVLVAGCGGDSGEAGAVEGKIQATTTTTMITDLVEQVGGDEVEVSGLMGPGVDPHLYEPSQGDVDQLLEADVIFYNGLFLEGQMNDVLVQSAQQTPAVQVTEAVPEDSLLPSQDYEGQADPHVWWDPTLWETTIDPVVDQLSELKPDAAEGFEQRGEEYRQEILAAHEDAQEMAAEVPEEQRVLVTAHDAFGYFGEQYGFEVRGLQGLSTETEAGAGDVRELAEYLAENEIPAIYIESTVPQRNVEAVQAATRDRGWEVEIGGTLYSDAIGEPGTRGGTYPGAFLENTEKITGGLAQ
ncbi:MAG: metal ABC transporter solute-binding protein, Zn/Mn family [Rubrobacteraceae bacterium]